MRLRCPQCQNQVEAEPGPLGTLRCPQCRSSIRVVRPIAARQLDVPPGDLQTSDEPHAADPARQAATRNDDTRLADAQQVETRPNPDAEDGSNQDLTLAETGDPGASGIGEAISARPRLGSYAIIGEIGRGGMGRVYKAVHTTLRQVRALKVLGKKERDDPKAVARFQREARMVAQLDHPHVVKIFEFDQDPHRGFYYIVMELVDGGSVSRILRKKGRLPWQQATEITLQIALGLGEMHKHGLVHRDIKPSNILIDRQGTAKLADLGLARHEGEGTDTQLTATGAVMGTIDYMAPEQIVDARQADVRSDLYSLGCTLFHMLAGRVPFPDGSGYQKIQQQINDPLPEVGPLAPDVPFQLVLILNRMTEKDPINRYQTPEELIVDLQSISGEPTPSDDVQQSTILQLQALAEAAAKDRSGTSLASWSTRDTTLTSLREIGRSPALLLAAALAVALLFGLIWYFVLRTS